MDAPTIEICGAHSAQGSICERQPHREGDGCHEAFVGGDSRRWWGDARWARWEWIVYEFETGRAADDRA